MGQACESQCIIWVCQNNRFSLFLDVHLISDTRPLPSQYELLKLTHCESSICAFLRILQLNQNYQSASAWLTSPCYSVLLLLSVLTQPSRFIGLQSTKRKDKLPQVVVTYWWWKGRGLFLVLLCCLAVTLTGTGMLVHIWFTGNSPALPLRFRFFVEVAIAS